MKNIIIITNTYGFLGNIQCTAYFKSVIGGRFPTFVYLDQSFGLKDANQTKECLVRELHNEVFLSGKFIFDRFKHITSDDKLCFFSEGLFSPFQIYAFHKLEKQISKYSCFSSVMPFGFQKEYE